HLSIVRRPTSTLFPYTTLFRSLSQENGSFHSRWSGCWAACRPLGIRQRLSRLGDRGYCGPRERASCPPPEHCGGPTPFRGRTGPLGGWVSAALIALLLVVASTPLAAQENAASVAVAVILSLSGGLSLRYPVLGASLIGVVMTMTFPGRD